jgi:CHAD domain-containing protein
VALVQSISERHRHAGNQRDLDVVQILIERIVEQAPTLQQRAALVEHQSIADAPGGARCEVLDAEVVGSG